ncbi:MAG: nucleotidyl transferase AbiEii/AbiGii toxin family protein [Clostridia bacterium]|nr:nucleotidyl transferase AbiEii/AbiGii toxin family protein [Clostridia bacterium]
MADIAASVLTKLKNKAKASGISYQQCLQLFVQEEFLRKLSKSGYEDNLILKGDLFIYTLTNFESRATIDVDFLLRSASNSMEDVKELINNVINTPTGNDYIFMIAKGFEEIDMRKRWKYFLKNIKDNTLEFTVVIDEIQKFLEPVFDAIVNENEWQKQWNSIKKWNKTKGVLNYE